MYKFLKELSDAGIVRREVDEASTPPRVFYHPPSTIGGWLFGHINVERARQIVAKKWTPRKKRERDGMGLAFSRFTNHLISVILDACEMKDEVQAEKYVDLQMQTALSEHVHELFRMCLRQRTVRVDGIPVLAAVADSFLCDADAEEWLKHHAPKWAKPYIGRLPYEFMADILMLKAHKEAAIKDIEQVIEAIETSRSTAALPSSKETH